MREPIAREIIFAIGDNMREGLEPLLTKTLAPSLYQVYLHAEDFDRLRTILPQVEEEAKEHLNRQLAELARGVLPAMERVRGRLNKRLPLGGLGRRTAAGDQPMQYLPAAGDWSIRFQEDPNERLEPGEIEVVSELAFDHAPSYGSGSKTQRISISTTRKLGRSTSERQTSPIAGEGPANAGDDPNVGADPANVGADPANVGADPANVGADPANVGADPANARQKSAAADSEHASQPALPPLPIPPMATGSNGGPWAVVSYLDDRGPQRFSVTQEEIIIGRDATRGVADLRLKTRADVSRRHAKIRRNPQTGGFWIEDLSQFGTEVNGRSLPQGVEVELPDAATISLASVVTLEFVKSRP